MVPPLPSSFSSPPHKISKSSAKTIMIFFSFSFSITIILRRDLIWYIYIYFLIEMPVWNSTGCFWGMGANARYLFPEIEKKTWLSSPSPQFFRPLINTNTNLVWSFNPSYHNNRIINLTPMSSGLFILLLLFLSNRWCALRFRYMNWTKNTKDRFVLVSIYLNGESPNMVVRDRIIRVQLFVVVLPYLLIHYYNFV